jgi:hypothetical protein
MLVLAEAHLQAGSLSEAHRWLQRAYESIPARGWERLRPQADALATRL